MESNNDLIEKELLRAINRCSLYFVEADNSLIYEKIDTLVLHWIPNKHKLYMSEGLALNIRGKCPESLREEKVFKEYLIQQARNAYGFTIFELEYMNDDFKK